MGHGFLPKDFQVPIDLHLLTDRMKLVPGTSALTHSEIENPSLFSELLAARVPEDWPPESVPDPSSPYGDGWWVWYFLTHPQASEKSVLIGLGGLKGWPAVNGSVQLGCSFLPEYQKSGYGTEAVRALTEWALSQPSVKQVYADISTENPAAHGVLKSIGFVLAGEGAGENLTRFVRSV
jgi:ribosomal-protein-alanine N-acetyltransferase